jgi:catechol 2,3-dioxygenase-like lactoylglutathione lyase family enzyme
MLMAISSSISPRESLSTRSVTAAETGKRCALEMGGKNAIIVLDDADLALAVDGIVWSAFGTRRAEEFVRYGFEHAETLEYTNWFAKVYPREGYPALFIDQAFPGERGKGSIIPAWVEKFGDRHLHHVAVLVDDIDKAIAAMKENGIAFTGEIVGRHSGALRQIFTQTEKRDGEPFTVLELTERHFGFKGFSPPQAQGLMESTVAHKKAA